MHSDMKRWTKCGWLLEEPWKYSAGVLQAIADKSSPSLEKEMFKAKLLLLS